MSRPRYRHTGGTLDKLESIPGFRVQLSQGEFLHQLERIGVAVTAQSERIVPADRILYALRDVTATVENDGLIAASIMAKKIATGTAAIVLDLKVGRGAFMADLEQARDLAGLCAAVGASFGRPVTSFFTAMDAPLGLAVGNRLEVEEAWQVLTDGGPPTCAARAPPQRLLASRTWSDRGGGRRARSAPPRRKAFARARRAPGAGRRYHLRQPG
jgi:thymidine phosphorylase